MRLVLHSLSNFVIFAMPGLIPAQVVQGNDPNAAARTHSRHSRVVDLDAQAAIRNALGCISLPFV